MHRFVQFIRDLALIPSIWRQAVAAERYRREGELRLPATRARIAEREVRYRKGFRYRAYEEPLLDAQGEQSVLIARRTRSCGTLFGPVLPDRLVERTNREARA